MNAAAQIGKSCPCENALYKDSSGDGYLLSISRGSIPLESYNRICNVLSEYGSMKRGATGTGFLEEHCETILGSNAIQNLAFS